MKKEFTGILLLLAISFGHCLMCFSQTNQPPVVSADGDLIYCPISQTPVVSFFSVQDADDTEIEAFFVQISIGYQRGFDKLTLSGNHPNISTSWNDVEGKLTLRGSNGGQVAYTDLIPAIYDVIFESTSINPTQEKEFSLTIGEANYLPSTGHYYEYVRDIGITWQEARIAAGNRTYFGLRGYLATITSPEEAQLSGEQAAGAGWIGGSDETNEGIWRWMTGPEAGTIFWNGGISGSSPNFEFWNTNEPNNCCEGEDYAHVTSPNVGIPGSWNDLSNEGDQLGDFQPKGYIVEYGGFTDDPELQLSASTKLRVPKIKATTEMANCGPGNLQLSAEATEGEVLWFDAPDGGNLIYSGSNFLTPVLNETTSYFVLASVNGCIEGKRTEVVGTIHPLPLIETTLLFKNCDEDGNPDGIVDFNLNEATDIVTLGDTDMEVTYHLLFSEAEASVNEINTSPFSNAVANMVYARVETSFGCYAIATVNLEVSITSFPTDFVAEIELCDGDEPDGFYEFDLRAIEAELLDLFPLGQNLKASFYRTAENALLEEQEINEVYRNEVAFSQILFVRVENQTDGACFGIGPHVRLAVLPLVDFSLPNQIQVCTGTTETVEIFDAEGEYIYEWKDANNAVVSTENTASLSEPGIYEVLAISENGCISPTKTIEVKASEAPNLRLDLITSEQVDGINSIVIEKEELGLGDYEFSLDNPFGPFQDSPIFNNVLPGMHMVYAADKNGCGGDALEIGVIGISNFITPNADNNNDFLEVLGITEETYQSVSLKIFNRYGKLLSQLNGFSDSWDGRVQNQLLPSSDYWFILEAIDFNGNLQKRTGHFTLKR